MSDKIFYEKIINPFKAPIYEGSRKYQVYYKVVIEQLGNNPYPHFSISGVHAPLPSGNCLGSCGQNIDDFWDEPIKFNKGWDYKLYKKLINIWRLYHLKNVKGESDLKFFKEECGQFPETEKQPAWI